MPPSSISLTHPPSISRRVSIRFLPRPPTEPTDTLVLNGGGTTNLFTDFRPLREDQSKCEWAFAGVKKFLDDGRCQWDHLVDNRAVESGEEVFPDIGHCSIGEDDNEIEHGTMMNPETGKVEEYVEVWKDEQIPVGSRVLVLRLQRANATDAETRGIFMMIGNCAQVIVRIDFGVLARRWVFTGGWKELQSYGDRSQTLPTPRGDTLASTIVDVPQNEPSAGFQWIWKVAEDYTWSPHIQS